MPLRYFSLGDVLHLRKVHFLERLKDNNMKYILRYFFAYSTLLIPVSGLYALEDGVDETSFFPIGVYYVMGQKPIGDMGDDMNDIRLNPELAYKEYFKEFSDLKGYGFNTAILMLNPLVHSEGTIGDIYKESDSRKIKEIQRSVVENLVDAAEKASLQIVVPVNNTTNLLRERHETLSNVDIEESLASDYIHEFKNSSAVLGYQIFDEPVPEGQPGPNSNVVKAEQLGQVNASIFSTDSNALALSTWNNIDIMNELNKGMNPKALLMDLYPFATDEYNGDQASGDTPLGDLSDAFPRGKEEDGSFNLGKDQPTFSAWIEEAQRVVGDRPAWVAFQAFNSNEPYWRKPDPKELRLQSFVAIKNGAKGLFYFLYQSEDWVDGMMDIHYQETPLIQEAKKINKKVSALAPTLLKLSRTQNYASSDDAHVQTFVHENGEKYLIAVNKDVKQAHTVTVLIDRAWILEADVVTDQYTGEELTVTVKDANHVQLELPLDVADGRVLLLGQSHKACDTTTFQLPNNQWRQISLPCNPGGDNTIAALFGDDDLGEFNKNWGIYRYNGTAYDKLTLDTPLTQGTGYWIIQKNDAGKEKTLDLPDGSVATLSEVFKIQLQTKQSATGWNMIGSPFETASLISDFRIKANTDGCTVGCSLMDAQSKGIVHNGLWSYNGVGYVELGSHDSVNPWASYWLATLHNAEGANPQLQISPP
jgi:hypothetical protein